MKTRTLLQLGLALALAAGCGPAPTPTVTVGPGTASAPPATRGWTWPTPAALPPDLYLPLLQADVTPLPPPSASPSPTAEVPTPAPSTPSPPEPTPPPTPAWPAALSAPPASKLGLHVIQNSDPYIMEFVRRIRPRIMKALDDAGWLSEVKAISPETVTVARFSVVQYENWVGTVDPAEAARVFVSESLERYRLNPGVDYWEGWNEYVYSDPAQLQWYAQFEAARACLMQQNGLRAAVGAFGVGWPRTFDEMALFLPALEAARRCGGIFTLHEYNSPTLQCGVAVNTPGLIPGAPALSVPAGSHSLRYRIWYEGLLKPRGLGDLPLVISETGLDRVNQEACGNPGGSTWKDYQAWWVQQGLGPDGPQSYVNTLAGYDQELQRDAYVLGATVFTAGALGEAERWHPFDVHDVIIPLAFYAAGQRP